MTFRSDARGFLVGELLDTNRSLLRAAQQDRAIWRGIAADVGAIANALSRGAGAAGSSSANARSVGAATVAPKGRGAVSSSGRGSTEVGAAAKAAAQVAMNARARTVVARTRDVRGRFAEAGRSGVWATESMPMLAGQTPVAAPRRAGLRASNGRFVAGQRGRHGDAQAPDIAGTGSVQGVARSVVAGLLDAAGGGASSVDPTLQAAAEIKDVIAPLGRGMLSAMGERRKEAKRERWYGRILKALSPKRATGVDVAAAAGGAAGGGGGLLGTMTGAMSGMLGRALPSIAGLLVRALPAVAAALLPALAGLASGALGTWIGTKIYNWLDSSGILAKVFDAFDNVRSFIDDAKKKATTWIGDAATGLKQGFTGNPALDASGRVIDDPRRIDAAPKSLPQRVGEAVGTGARAVMDAVARPATALAKAVDKAAEIASTSVRSVVGAGKGYTEIEQADGTLSRRTGARNWRNNNPGNLEFNDYTKSLGAVGSDGRFAVFPTLAAGRQAQGKMLFEGAKYKGLDLKAAIARYAPPKENDTQRYQSAVLASVGGANKTMASYSQVEREAILDAMARLEGFKAGTITAVAAPAAVPVFSRSTGAVAALPSMPVSPSLPAVPKVDLPVRPDGERLRPQVVIVREQVGQNVQDRGIAHAVTGGLGG